MLTVTLYISALPPVDGADHVTLSSVDDMFTIVRPTTLPGAIHHVCVFVEERMCVCLQVCETTTYVFDEKVYSVSAQEAERSLYRKYFPN